MARIMRSVKNTMPAINNIGSKVALAKLLIQFLNRSSENSNNKQVMNIGANEINKDIYKKDMIYESNVPKMARNTLHIPNNNNNANAGPILEVKDKAIILI